MTTLPTLGLTIGDPAGIGPEIVLKSLVDKETRATARSFAIGDLQIMKRTAASLGLGVRLLSISGPEDLPDVGFDDVGTVYVLDTGEVGEIEYGVVDRRGGQAAISSIETACDLALSGRIDGIVTAPLNKEAIWAAGSKFPGHTEMLGSLLGVEGRDVVTVFVLEKMRIFFLTRHLPLVDAISGLTIESVDAGIHNMHRLLGELGIPSPHMAVAAVNPHAGENGHIGTDEQRVLEPAIAKAQEEGLDVVGPVPADAVFHQALRGAYDGVLSLYHDQGHIASKTVDFFGTVSLTLGLRVIRTSVDHGTAYDIAGRGIADPGGQIRAIKVAAELAPQVLAVHAGGAL